MPSVTACRINGCRLEFGTEIVTAKDGLLATLRLEHREGKSGSRIKK